MPALPSSLSPHICIRSSEDLKKVLADASLPALPVVLQSFSPLPQVTTRTTTLVSVPHKSFSLRFSDLEEIEASCYEDEEERAVRAVDWISERIGQQSAKWVEEMEKYKGKEPLKSPWWEEVRRCAEGEHTPSRTETWNHPAAVIFAVSTTAPNPLQAITSLQSEPVDLPSWVDPSYLRYTLIVHPDNSPLSNEEAGALFNAVKKQYGLHAYLLPLALPKPAPTPVAVPVAMPRLPPPPNSDLPTLPPPPDSLAMSEKDINQTAKFTREFVVQSLIPWMERCVVEWNEAYTSTRRLPSRLFSSTRRLFGSPATPASPTHTTSSSISSLPSRSQTMNMANTSQSATPQQRRLAEFATILGDIKLAISVWETLRKDNRGGSDVLPLLLAPSPALQLHASNALSPLRVNEPFAQFRALIYAVRWELGIGHPEFLDSSLEGDRWLVLAAGDSEEPTAALLLAHAALLNVIKGYDRRAALLYYSAAKRLEQSGIKPLTMYFLRRAHDLLGLRMPKELSPSFWDAENIAPSEAETFDNIQYGVEHPLGRLLYTTGEVATAVQFFLGLLCNSPSTGAVSGIDAEQQENPQRLILEDFRVAFSHHNSNSNESLDLKLPFSFAAPRESRLRLPRDVLEGDSSAWEAREETWNSFRRQKGIKEPLVKIGKAFIDETFWVDLLLRNPLDVEVNLSSLTVGVREAKAVDASSSQSFIEVEVVDSVILDPKESRTIPIAIKASQSASLEITHVAYSFLSLLSTTESLATRGRRLQDTQAQRVTRSYAPDVFMKVDIAKASQKLLVTLAADHHFSLCHGEMKELTCTFQNAGSSPIGELWMIAGSEDEISLLEQEEEESDEVDLQSNQMTPILPIRIPLSLQPDEEAEFSLMLHADRPGEQELCLLFVYREADSQPFHSARVIRAYEVHRICSTSVTARPSHEPEDLFRLTLNVQNTSSSYPLLVREIVAVSPMWKSDAISGNESSTIAPLQTSRFTFGATPWADRSELQSTVDFVIRQLRSVLKGETVSSEPPPRLKLIHSQINSSSGQSSALDKPTQMSIDSARRNYVLRSMARLLAYVPAQSHYSLFPVHDPNSIDLIVFWEIPSSSRSGHCYIPGTTLGARHAEMQDIIHEAEVSKVKRSMYAETERERQEIMDAIRRSEWNSEMNPLQLKPLQHSLTMDLKDGPCVVPVEFSIRNYSLTNVARFVLHVTSGFAGPHPDPRFHSPRYRGRLTSRGVLEPCQSIRVRCELWVSRPGIYAVGQWRLETEVLERKSDEARVRHRYIERATSDDQPFVILNEK